MYVCVCLLLRGGVPPGVHEENLQGRGRVKRVNRVSRVSRASRCGRFHSGSSVSLWSVESVGSVELVGSGASEE
jgi:hypothetical protein